jgi:hypothetical protein
MPSNIHLIFDFSFFLSPVPARMSYDAGGAPPIPPAPAPTGKRRPSLAAPKFGDDDGGGGGGVAKRRPSLAAPKYGTLGRDGKPKVNRGAVGGDDGPEKSFRI